ncbi:MAG: deoxyribonuclease IV [Thermodesulfovibrionales bacterium]
MSEGVRRIGVHTSIAGGIYLSIERARRLGCNTVQIFSHSPRSWALRKITKEEIQDFRRLRSLYDISPVYIHTSYLINLASSNKVVAEKSVELLSKEMEIADELGADYLVLHPGSASDSEKAGLERIIKNLKRSLKRNYRSKLLLENTAGERGDLTSRIHQLARIIKSLNNKSIGGICIDTCHAFQGGYDISCDEGVTALIDEIKGEIGLDRLKLLHLNDSKKAFGSGVDRHEHIGKGSIGEKGFETLLNNPFLSNVPVILETPKENDEDDLRNLKVVRRLARLF